MLCSTSTVPEQTSKWLISKENFVTFDLEIMDAHWLFFNNLKKMHIISEEFCFGFFFNISEAFFFKKWSQAVSSVFRGFFKNWKMKANSLNQDLFMFWLPFTSKIHFSKVAFNLDLVCPGVPRRTPKGLEKVTKESKNNSQRALLHTSTVVPGCWVKKKMSRF